jgi:hypothetical protein
MARCRKPNFQMPESMKYKLAIHTGCAKGAHATHLTQMSCAGYAQYLRYGTYNVMYERDSHKVPSPQPNGLGLLERHCSPLEHNWLQLEHPWLPLVSLASTGLPWAAHWCYLNTLGNTPET